MPIAAAFQLAEAEHGTLGALGHYNTPKEGVHGEYRGGTIGASPAYSFTAHVAEVEVDPETGFVDVKTIWVAHDCGRALNPMLVEGQMEGSAYMGFAEAIMEQQVMKRGEPEGGLHDAPSLLDYRIPTSLDCPGVRGADRGGGRPRRALRREGSRGRAPAPVAPGDRQRDLGRGGRAHGLASVHAGPGVAGAARTQEGLA